MTIAFCAAGIDDAPLLAELVNYAGEGLPLYLWQRMAEPGESPWDVGRRRAARTEGSFSFRNAVMARNDGEHTGCVIGYPLPDVPEPVPSDMPPMFRPLQELENEAPGSWYINVLAVIPAHRGETVTKPPLLGELETPESGGVAAPAPAADPVTEPESAEADNVVQFTHRTGTTSSS